MQLKEKKIEDIKQLLIKTILIYLKYKIMKIITILIFFLCNINFIIS